jgi:hypothetical protein
MLGSILQQQLLQRRNWNFFKRARRKPIGDGMRQDCTPPTTVLYEVTTGDARSQNYLSRRMKRATNIPCPRPAAKRPGTAFDKRDQRE